MSIHLPSVSKTLFTLIFFITLEATAQPAITSFSPSSGPVGTSVTIAGTNFNAVAANNIVFFGAVKASVTAATIISLTVTVPAGATYQPISVLDNATDLTGYSSKPFITTFPGSLGIPANFYKPKVDFATDVSPWSVAISDVDGDGKPDLVVANQTNFVSVLQNVSAPGNITTSSFAAKVDFATGGTPYSVAVGDVDGDGKPDLIVANSGSATVSVLRNTFTSGSISSSSFAAKVDFTTGSSPFSVAIGDVDGDGKPDIAVANSGSSTVSVLHNTSTTGSISFATKIDFATGTTPYSVAISDVDGDGKPDLVTANQNSANISVLRNTSTSGTISAATKVDFTTGSVPRSVAIGDVDGDGKPDFVAGNNNGNSISVLLNTSTSGSISAAAKVDFTTGTNPRSVTIGDVDGDGKPDLLVANITAPYSISVFRNTSTSGSVSIAAKVDFATGNAPVSIAIGDVDGDGIPEIATANSSSVSASVFQIDLSVLPVTLTNVKTYQKNAGVEVDWTTQQDGNIDRYEVEKSPNGQQFFKLGSVQAKGNSSVALNYSMLDPNPLSGVSFYRIKIIDKSAQVTYSQVMKMKISIGATLVTVYPNPVNSNTIILQVSNLQKGSYTITLTNKLGQQIITKVIDHAGGSSTQTIEPSNILAAGVYQLRLSGKGINITRQVIKN